MGNASDTSDVFVSKISKEHDILIGSIYSVFCKFAAFHAPCARFLSQQRVFSSPCRYSVPHGQLHPAASRISQAVHAEAGRVLHRQSVHQRPGDDAHLVSSGDTVFFFTQVWTHGCRFGPNRLRSFQNCCIASVPCLSRCLSKVGKTEETRKQEEGKSDNAELGHNNLLPRSPEHLRV